MRYPPATANSLVSRLEAFGPLPEEDKLLLAGLALGARRLPPQTDLIREGDAPNDVQLVLSGYACRYKTNDDGQRQVLAFLLPGDFSDFDGRMLSKIDHSIGTLSECVIVSIGPDCVSAMLERTALARALKMATLVEMANAREWIVNIGRRGCRQRVAHLLCEIYARLDAVGLVENDGFALPLTQSDLADTTGMSVVHVNRSLRELRVAGLIELKSRRMTVVDIKALQAVGEFVPNYLHLDEIAAA